MRKIIIAAIAPNKVIGKGGKLPWHIPEDLKNFKKETMGSPIIMGSKTLDSLRDTLVGRQYIVLSKKRQGGIFVDSLDRAYGKAYLSKGFTNKCFIIGGAEVFKLALPTATDMIITNIQKQYDGDTFFPLDNISEQWSIKSVKRLTEDVSVTHYIRRIGRNKSL